VRQLAANRHNHTAVGRDRRFLGQRGVEVIRFRRFFVVDPVAIEVHTVLNYGIVSELLGHGKLSKLADVPRRQLSGSQG
jgi:hypothetical protein